MHLDFGVFRTLPQSRTLCHFLCKIELPETPRLLFGDMCIDLMLSLSLAAYRLE